MRLAALGMGLVLCASPMFSSPVQAQNFSTSMHTTRIESKCMYGRIYQRIVSLRGGVAVAWGPWYSTQRSCI